MDACSAREYFRLLVTVNDKYAIVRREQFGILHIQLCGRRTADTLGRRPEVRGRTLSFSCRKSKDFRHSPSSGSNGFIKTLTMRRRHQPTFDVLITLSMLLLRVGEVLKKPRQREGRRQPTFVVLMNPRRSKESERSILTVRTRRILQDSSISEWCIRIRQVIRPGGREESFRIFRR
jgi:hypothetical protein